jgi:hypothetical protein
MCNFIQVTTINTNINLYIFIRGNPIKSLISSYCQYSYFTMKSCYVGTLNANTYTETFKGCEMKMYTNENIIIMIYQY